MGRRERKGRRGETGRVIATEIESEEQEDQNDSDKDNLKKGVSMMDLYKYCTESKGKQER